MSRLWVYVLAFGVAAACSPSSSELGEVAAELRALRLQSRTPPATTTAPLQVAEALSPLRTALDGMLATQRDLQAQQVELAREMQRWTQFVGESVHAARSEEGKALATRLLELEQKMAQQEVRHREVETLLRGALDRTSERLESFLLQLQSVSRPAGTGAAANPEPATAPAAGEMEPKPAGEGKQGAMSGAAPSRSVFPSTVGWWILLVGSLLVGGNLFLRAFVRRSTRRAHHPGPAGGAAMAAPTTAALPGAPGSALESTEEIWAAAALLGEAVDRLRRENGGPSPAPAAGVPGQEPGDLDFAGLDEDELFVVEGLDEPTTEPTAVLPALARPRVPEPKLIPVPPSATPVAIEPGAASRVVAAVLPRRAPAQFSFRLRARDPAHACSALLKILREDPRVLQRPEPRVQGAGPEVVCQFAVLPGLPAGECSVLEQRLRDSVG